jgi:integrase
MPIRQAPRNIVPTPEEAARLIAAPDLGLRWLLLCAAHCALRFGTSLRVTPNDCIGGVIRRRSKGGSTVEIALSQPMVDLLAVAHGDQNQPVCNLLAGRTLTKQGWQFRWRAWKKRLGIRKELRPHDLRRALARAVYDTTGDLRQVQSLLGHASLRATFHYLGEARTEPTNQAALRAAREQVTGEKP